MNNGNEPWKRLCSNMGPALDAAAADDDDEYVNYFIIIQQSVVMNVIFAFSRSRCSVYLLLF